MKLLRLLLVVAVVSSALGVVWSTHTHRSLVSDAELLSARSHRLSVEWGQLQLEEAALAHPGRVDAAAREQLGMELPRNRTVVEVER